MADEPSPTPRQRALASFRAAKAAAAASAEDAAADSEATGDRRPEEIRAGDVLSLPVSDVDGVYWWIRSIDGDRARLVPVDDAPLVGPDDSPVDGDGPPWVVRPAHEITLPLSVIQASFVEGGRRVHRIDPEMESTGAAPEAAPEPLRCSAESADYRQWIEEGPAAARRRLAALPLPFERPEASRSRRRRAGSRTGMPGRWQGWLAAVLALVVLGLGLQLGRLQQQVEELSRPIVDLPYREIRLDPEIRGDWRLDVPAGASHVQLGLLLPELADGERYRLSVETAEGKVVYRSQALTPAREYTLTLPTALLGEEPLRLRLEALRRDEWISVYEESLLGEETPPE